MFVKILPVGNEVVLTLYSVIGYQIMSIELHTTNSKGSVSSYGFTKSRLFKWKYDCSKKVISLYYTRFVLTVTYTLSVFSSMVLFYRQYVY